MTCGKYFLSLAALLFILSLRPASPLFANDYSIIRGTVIKVSDGDTVVIRPSGRKIFKCRLYGIDAPEVSVNGSPGQPFSHAAERELTNLVLNTTVDVTFTGDSSFDRSLCVIKRKGADINREMIKRGYAWAYREFLKGPYISQYISAETEARAMRRGLWVQSNPQPPWEFRNKYRN